MTFRTRTLAAVAALIALAQPLAAVAQSEYDEQQQLIARIQADKRAIVLETLALSDADVEKFTPIYDKYQVERKKHMERTTDLLNRFAANYGSMTDAAAKSLLDEWLDLREDEDDLIEKYAKQVQRSVNPTVALRFVQVENKVNTLLYLPALKYVPLAE